MKKLIFSALLLSAGLTYGQDYYYKDYDWQSKPISYTPFASEEEEDYIYIKNKQSTELVIPEGEGEGPYFVKLIHRVVFLNSDDAVEEYNKMFIGAPKSEEFELKARVITSKGKVIELDESNVQIAEDDEGNDLYRYFAFDGIDVGSTVEYFRIYKSTARLTGSEVRVQKSSIQKNLEYDFILPDYLKFQFHSINGLPDMQKDTLEAKADRFYISIDSLPGLRVEKTANFGANLGKFYYKLNENTATENSNFYTYSNVGTNIYESYYNGNSKKDLKAIKKFIKAANIDENADDRTKIRTFENYLKDELTVLDYSFETLSSPKFAYDNKITNDNGMTKIFLQFLKTYDIKHELIVTCDKTENAFNTDFEGYNFLEDFVIYINKLDTYLYPKHHSSRLGFIPTYFMGQQGIFIREKKVGDFYAAVSEIKTIHYNDIEDSQEDLEVLLTFNDDMTATANVERKATGYKAKVYQGSADFYTEEEEIEEFKHSFISFLDPESEAEDYSFDNLDPKELGNSPLIATGIVKSPTFVEPAGNKYLVNVGKLIGPQAEMYNDVERTQPVSDYFKRSYTRVIKVKIPEGYTFKELDALNIDVKLPNSDEAGFVSSYTVEGDMLIITVKEWYEKIEYSVEEYQGYQDVINAAADFNKLVLVLSKI